MDIKLLKKEIGEMLRSSKGRNIITFLIFFLVSALFWLLLALNDDVQHDYNVPLSVTELPGNTTLITGYNTNLNVTIRDKGASLLKFSLGTRPELKVRFSDLLHVDDTVRLITAAQLSSAIRWVFGPSSEIVAMRPDSLRIIITEKPGMRVPVNVLADVHPSPQSCYTGHPVVVPDSVTIYSNCKRRNLIKSISTVGITIDGASDTVTNTVKIAVPQGMRAVPSVVAVTFPIEPLVSKQLTVPIKVLNVPKGYRVVTFPSMAQVSYLLPKSIYSTEPGKISVSVDYRDISAESTKLQVTTPKLPSKFQSVSVNPPEVEYVIERIE